LADGAGVEHGQGGHYSLGVLVSHAPLFGGAGGIFSIRRARAIAGPSAGDGDDWAGQSSTIRLKPGDDLDAVHRVYLDTEKVEEVE
jgi:hypothetical protein